MSFQYIKKNKHKNEGVFVPLTEGEDLLENLEKEECQDDTVEDWNKLVANGQKESDHNKAPNK